MNRVAGGAKFVRIIGIDPGSVRTGYGIIESNGQRHRYIAHGVVQVAGTQWGDRLGHIFTALSEVVREYAPQESAIEEVFMGRNAMSALKLGQARGAAICALVQQQLAVSEYAARSVKLSVVGKGAASKEQMQYMVALLLSLRTKLQADAADALGVALCHAHHRGGHYAAALKNAGQ